MYKSNVMYEECDIRTYEEADRLFAKARHKEAGKPLRSWARLHKDGNDYLIKTGSITLFRITPDNMLIVECTPDELRRCACTVVSSLYRVIPFDIIRVGVGRYRLNHFANLFSKQTKWIEKDLLKKSPELFQGLTFSLLTGDCQNQRPDLLTTVDPAARKQWLGALRKYKRGLKVRQRIGAFDSIAALITTQKAARQYTKPDWDNDSWKDKLFECIRDEKYPEDLIIGVAQSVRVFYYQTTVTTQDILTQFDSLCNAYSIDLRKRFGVFGEA